MIERLARLAIVAAALAGCASRTLPPLHFAPPAELWAADLVSTPVPT